jgi:glutamate--cysteine ligase
MFDAEGLRVHRYIARAVAVPPMFFMRDGTHRPVEPRPFAHYAKEGFEGTPVTVRDFIDHLTTLFPEVRLKGYVELRGADCLPPAYATAISGFWRAILDDEPTRLAVEDRLQDMDYAAVRTLQPQIARWGLEGDSAAGPVLETARWLIDVAYRRMKEGAPDCAECLEPLVRLAEDGYAPADRMIETALRKSVEEAISPYEV